MNSDMVKPKRRRSRFPSIPVQKITRRRVPGIADPVDIHVGGRVRLRRTLMGLSQEKLGGAVGLTFQQIQKYERGANRIGASRMFDLSKVLDVPVSFFFDDISEEVKKRGTGARLLPHRRTVGAQTDFRAGQIPGPGRGRRLRPIAS